jgi:hypothetical protein
VFGPGSQSNTGRIKYEEPTYLIVPAYQLRSGKVGGYLAKSAVPQKLGPARAGFSRPENVYFLSVKPSEWAGKVGELSAMVSSAFEAFIATVRGWSNESFIHDFVLSFSDTGGVF